MIEVVRSKQEFQRSRAIGELLEGLYRDALDGRGSAAIKLRCLPSLALDPGAYVLQTDGGGRFRFGVALARIARRSAVLRMVDEDVLPCGSETLDFECIFLTGPSAGTQISAIGLGAFWQTVMATAEWLGAKSLIGVQLEDMSATSDKELGERKGQGGPSRHRMNAGPRANGTVACSLFEIECGQQLADFAEQLAETGQRDVGEAMRVLAGRAVGSGRGRSSGDRA